MIWGKYSGYTYVFPFYFLLCIMIKFGSLSENSWITSSSELADYLFSHIFLSDYNQTSIFPGHVCSLAHLIQRNINDISSMTLDIRNSVSKYLSNYFKDVNVDVQSSLDENDKSAVNLTIAATFVDDEGKFFNLGRALTYTNNKIINIINLNNTGVV